ncbi:hypothetical protein [Alteromonas sp. CYL-A6]|uniref:hypothetical protein n=1 Tax=Alteromonas nitratireducens TaxID=3390813 RepID=UPI0034A8CC13
MTFLLCCSAVRHGELRVILPELTPPPIGLYAVYPHRKLVSATIRSFLSFAESYYGDPPPWALTS